jgi:hypothetical protein
MTLDLRIGPGAMTSDPDLGRRRKGSEQSVNNLAPNTG